MAKLNLHPIKTPSDLNAVVMQLRLKQLPMTLDVLKQIRDVIEKPQLDEELRKVVEREFSSQWKEMKKKQNISSWKDYHFSYSEHSIPIKSHKLVKNQNKVSGPIQNKIEKIIKPKPKQTPIIVQKEINSKKNKNTKKSKSDKIKIFNVDIPRNIETSNQLNDVLRVIKKVKSRGEIIYDSTINLILSCITRADLKDYFRKSLNSIESHNPTKKIVGEINGINKIKNKIKGSRKSTFVSSFIPERAPVIIERASDSSNLYENFEYGLSDWDR